MRRLVAIVLSMLLVSLAFAADAVEIRSVTLCTAVKGIVTPAPVDPRERFTSEAAAIHAVVVLERVDEACAVRGAWISVDAIDVPNYEIGATDVEVASGGSASVHYSISKPTNGWPAGKYEFRLSLRGKLLRTTPFVVVPAAGAAPARAPRPGSIHRHAKGFAFWMPEGWTARPQDDGTVQILPPADGPDAAPELYSMSVESAAGKELKGSDDPQIVQFLDEQVRILQAKLARKGDARALETGLGTGALYQWEGKGDDGQMLRAHGFSCLAGDICVLVTGIGKADAVAGHESDLAVIFGTLTRGEPRTPLADPAPGGGADAGLRQKLAALEKAHQAGVLSDEEFARKKAELVPPALDPSVKKRLDALEAAHRSGVVSDEEYAAKKTEILGSVEGAAPGSALRRVVPGQRGRTYRHPVGFSMWYPDGWTVAVVEQLLQLAPPDPETSPAGPIEIYVVAGESVSGTGISESSDARLVQHFDEQIRGIAPFLRREAPPRPADMDDGKGTLLEWEGDNPMGDRILARARVAIVKDYAVALISIGHKAPLEKREADVRRIFASFRLGEGERDPQLAGTWSFLTSHAMTNWSPFETAASRANLASDSSATVALRADGTFTRTSRHHMIAGAGGVWVENDDVKTDRGRWFGGGGRAVLIGENESWEEYEYKVQQTAGGMRLLLVRDGNGELWERSRP